MSMSEDTEVLQMFMEESLEHLAEIENDLMDIEQAGGQADEDLVNKVFRAAHSIKGGAACLGLDNIKELSHAIENVLHLVRNNALSPDRKLVESLLAGFDSLRQMVADCTHSADHDISDLVGELVGLTTASLPKESKESVTTFVDVAPPGRDYPVFSISEFDLVMAGKGGNFIYLVEYDLIHDVQRMGKTPLSVIRTMEKSGNIVAGKIDLMAVGTLDDSPANTIPFFVLFSTIIDPEYISALFGAPREKIHLISSDPTALPRSTASSGPGGGGKSLAIALSGQCGATAYHIRFQPEPGVFLSGFSLISVFDELRDLGDVLLVAHATDVPELESLNPDVCFLSFDIVVVTARHENELRDVFIFVQDSPVLTIRSIPMCEALQTTDHWAMLEERIYESGGLADDLLTGDQLRSAPEPEGQTVTGAQDRAPLQTHPQGRVVPEPAPGRAVAVEPAGQYASSAAPSDASPPASTARTATGPASGTLPGTGAARTRPAASGAQNAQPAASGVNGSAKPKPAVGAPDDSMSSIRVPANRLDKLVDLVGELVIVQARLTQTLNERNFNVLPGIAEEIERLSNELRDSTLNIRMLPFGMTFTKFRRLVRDLSTKLGKEIELVTRGAETELDKTVIERLNDPLVHLLRNSIDHGIETPDIREAAGKPTRGVITLDAVHSGGEVHITITDDGAGIDPERIRAKAIQKGFIGPDAEFTAADAALMIFAPGFSTAAAVTDVSGRGVGMDVVKRNIEALRGRIEIESEKGAGTTITVILPLTLAIIDGLQVRVGEDSYVIPLTVVEECVELENSAETEKQRIINLRGEIVPFIRLREWFGCEGALPDIEQIVITRVDGQRAGFVVDEVVGQHQTVIKSLGRVYRDVEGISGATIKGDGSIALILDVSHLFKAVLKSASATK